jgi:hypothetical protein
MEFLSCVIKFGKTIDPEDTTVLYGWLYSSSIALQPFPSEYERFCNLCLHSVSPPEERWKKGLKILKNTFDRAQSGLAINEDNISDDYVRLLRRVSL